MDFNNRISNAQNTANSSYQTYNEYKQQADAAGNKFNQQFDQRQNYGNIYDEAKDKYYNTDEINQARGQYQTARDAVNQLNATISRLPESISQQYGGTGMTEAQRQRALQTQYSNNTNTYNMLNTNYQSALQDYNDLANRAMQEVQNVAAGNYQSQEYALNSLQNAWNTLLSQSNTAYQQNQTDRGLLADQYGARDNWQLAQDQLALDRWKEEQANARAAADRALQERLNNSKLNNLQKYLDNLSARQQPQYTQPTNDYQTYEAPKQKRETNIFGGEKGYGKDGKALNNAWDAIKNYGPLAIFGGGWGWY